ncbi:hypothetical protein K3556_03930 [Aliiroseovarius sp. M344]|uniref:hypothetical protein n=1 Tax=Aliiroseovarius sp. M344 TaxID=2867010 RepID=UPI0021AD8BDF|nr:hypothetical protein [Aliiroseovarius sp. M344]UWQ15054.1 hypothetical protein K3556_03930 [Aliiroseovarius sp. M344]
MRRFLVLPAMLAALALAGCQSSEKSQASGGAVTFCDRLIGWEAVKGEDGAERAITRAEVCAKPAGDGVWMKVPQVHSKLRGRSYWLLMPNTDRHLAASAADGSLVLAGWTLQARPFGWAHEIVAVRDEGKVQLGALPAGACPRKAVGKKPQIRYCIPAN